MIEHGVKSVSWRTRGPLLFDDSRPSRCAGRAALDRRAPAERSPAALEKIRGRRTAEDLPVHSFQTLLKDLATLTRNQTRVAPSTVTFDQLARPTPLQQRALELLQVSAR